VSLGVQQEHAGMQNLPVVLLGCESFAKHISTMLLEFQRKVGRSYVLPAKRCYYSTN
jgi:hypothetical protein